MGAVALGLLVAGALFSDALSAPTERVVGASNTETYPFMWGFFWMAQSLFEEGRLAYETTLLNYPYGGALWLKEPVFTLLFSPFFDALGAARCYTFTQIAHTVLGTVGLAVLAAQLGCRPWLAAVCGLTFGFCPHMLGEAYNGNLDAMNIGWAPLWLAAVLRLIERPTVLAALAAGGALTVMLVANQYFAVATGLACGPLALLALYQRWRRGEAMVDLLVLGLGALVLGLTLSAPMLLRLAESLDDPRALSLFEAEIPRKPPYVSDLAHLWQPMRAFGDGPPPTTFQDLVYPGLALVALALLAPLVRGRHRPWALLSAALGLGYASLSLGPILWYRGAPVGEEPVFLPWYYLIEGQPLLGAMSLPHRMAIPAGLFFSLAAALGLDGLGRRLQAAVEARGGAPRERRAAWVLPGVLAVGALLEQILFPPYQVPLATLRLPPIGASTLLRALSAKGAVLNLPPMHSENALNADLYQQTIHRRPIAGTLRVGQWPAIARKVPLLGRDVAYLHNLPLARPEFDVAEDDPYGIDVLREAGFAFVVLNLYELTRPEKWHMVPTWGLLLGDALGEGLLLESGVVVYALDPEVNAQLGEEAQRVLGDEWVVAHELDWLDRIEETCIVPPRREGQEPPPREPPPQEPRLPEEPPQLP